MTAKKLAKLKDKAAGLVKQSFYDAQDVVDLFGWDNYQDLIDVEIASDWGWMLHIDGIDESRWFAGDDEAVDQIKKRLAVFEVLGDCWLRIDN